MNETEFEEILGCFPEALASVSSVSHASRFAIEVPHEFRSISEVFYVEPRVAKYMVKET